VAWVNNHYGVVHVRFIRTRRDYDKIDAQTV
jgi:mRNA-degrading endonuclease HigB of HigAB toxin-antitoxin module